ncbi:MAG TPA: FtsX-like permease family protein [Gaiellaceae bacterium]|nr:FtsX-like permease family protein [Gaiellaceae bacterium]
MGKLFGIPVDELAVVLLALLAAGLAVVGLLALRNRVFFRMGIRNIRRRPGRSALIVVGSMLGTAIIAAALATGDTMGRTVRSSAISALGQADEVVAAQGVATALAAGTEGTTGTRYFPESYAGKIRAATQGSGLVDGVTPVIVETIAVQDLTTRQNEPRATLFAADPESMRPFGDITSDGETVSLADLKAGEVYLNADAADELDAKAGDMLRVLAGQEFINATVKAIVHYDGGATDGSGLLLPLSEAQRLLDKPGLVKAVFVSNTGGAESGAELSGQVIDRLEPTLAPLGLEADNTKEDALAAADTAGGAFMSMFTTFGSFSIAAGILLIFLIFVMLAAERRGELGIARAVGTRRGHLVQMFLFEGVAYDLMAAAIGVLLGVAVAYGMVLVMAAAFAQAFGDFEISYSVKPTSLVVSYAIGVLVTLLVVTFSAWRVSRMNIVSAIRDLPDPPVEKERRRRWILGIVGVLLGGLLAVSGVSAEDAVALGLGVALIVLSFVPILHALGLPDRAVHTCAGLALLTWFLLPIDRWLFGELKVNFSMFLLGGLMIVIGATWTIVYNADVLLGAVASTLGRIRALAPVLRMSIAYPLRSVFRTGVTLAMFTLVVFTIVVGSITTSSFLGAMDNVQVFGGGFDVRATASPASPVPDMPDALRFARGVDPADFRVVASVSDLPVDAKQVGTEAKPETYVVHGADRAYLTNTTYSLATRAKGYESDAAVWQAIRDGKNLAVVDAFVVPRRANWAFGPMPAFRLSGLYLEDEAFDPIPVQVEDPQTGKSLTVHVIGVLSDRTPELMAGIWTSQSSVVAVFGDRVIPTTYLFAVRDGVDSDAEAKALESAFLSHGMQADSLQSLLDDVIGGNLTFNRLIMGFMGLGLIVGVAALGVISARSVVERRQQIGVLRAIGFRKQMVQACFLLESSFIALTSIVIGTGLGVLVGHNVIRDSRQTPSWEGMAFIVPWWTFVVVFLVVYAVALATTFLPALRASRVYPAEALRYQ